MEGHVGKKLSEYIFGSGDRHVKTIFCCIFKLILQKMVSISSTPLSPAMKKYINMDELRRLEATNAATTQMLMSKQKHPSISSERLKRLRRAVVKYSKKQRPTTSSMERARKSSEKRAKREAMRRRKIYYAKKRPGSPKKTYSNSRPKIYELSWYNQPSYRGSPSLRRRRRSKRSGHRRP